MNAEELLAKSEAFYYVARDLNAQSQKLAAIADTLMTAADAYSDAASKEREKEKAK